MSTIVLISCVSKKLSRRARARDLYISPLFRKSLEYAERLSSEKIFVLSAKYGLVGLDDEIDPYDATLNEMTASERKKWSREVLAQLRQHCDLERDHFVIIAGKKYRQYLLPELRSYHVPLEGLSIGKQLQFLSKETSNE